MADTDHLRAIHRQVESARAGDPHAMDDLITMLRPGIFNYCRSRLSTFPGGIQMADDAVQETCLAVCKIVPRYRDRGLPFTALVYAIASNKIADAMRGYSRSAVLVDEIPDQAEPSPGPEDQLLTSVHLRAAHQLIDRLPPKMRDVLLLRVAGVSADHVAERLGISVGSVRVTHHRAVARLRRMVEESDEHSELFSAGSLVAT